MRDEKNQISLKVTPQGRSGKVALTATCPDGGTFTNQLTITSEQSRDRFVEKLCDRFPGLDPEPLHERLEELAAGSGATEVVDQDDGSQADMAVALVESEDVKLFHAPGEMEAEGYASVIINGRQETFSLNSSSFKTWLRQRFYTEHKKVLRSQSVTDAIGNISAKAIYESEEIPVDIRVAGHGDMIYIDRVDADWTVIEVSATGWRVIPAQEAPVRFVRRRGMLSLPMPVKGGDIRVLQELVNIPDEQDLVLVTVFLVACLLPKGPYPILIVNGEQGSAKTTLCRLLRMLVDPNKAPVRRPARCEQDLMIAATNARVIGFDNVSGIASTLSDALCALATGTGFSTRQLYSDDSERIFDAARPVILNGIDELGRADLLDRAIVLRLPTIPPDRRRTQASIDAAFDRARGRLLGVLLDGVSAYLRNRDSVRFDEIPRMADFAAVGMAVETSFGWSPGTFMASYTGNRADSHIVAVEASPIGPALQAFLAERTEWEGTASELLGELGRFADEKVLVSKAWPQNGRGMSSAFSRLAADLRALGYVIDHGRATDSKRRDRLIRIAVPRAAAARSGASDSGRSADGPGAFRTIDRPAEQRFSTPPGPIPDDPDGPDGRPHTLNPKDRRHPGDETASGAQEEGFDPDGDRARAREKEVGKRSSGPSGPSGETGGRFPVGSGAGGNGGFQGIGNGMGGGC